jgi:hypothetical protein
MDPNKLADRNPAVVKVYVEKKFKKFSGFFYGSAAREKKAIEYWLAAQGSDHGQETVEMVYQDAFGQMFPIEKAERTARERVHTPAKKESSQWYDDQKTHLVNLEFALEDLTKWKADQDYQYGDEWLAKLKTRVQFIDGTLCDTAQFATDFGAECKAKIGTTSEATARSRKAGFEGMVGFEQHASLTFEAYSPKWGEINAKLEESFKAGAWTSGSAEATMNALGFTAEVKAAVAIGAQLNLSGEMAWKKGRAGLALEGEVEVFAGAQASFEAKLSVNAMEGIEAALKVGAFAGFKVEAKGSCSFSYDGQDIVKVEASAGITFGVGAEFEASIKAPIFGPTEIKIAASLSMGFGTSTSANASIDFSEAGLAASQEFRALVYWRTLAKGYQPDLMNSDARNLHYLNKSIHRIEAEIESVNETIESFDKVPMEKRSLLQ